PFTLPGRERTLQDRHRLLRQATGQRPPYVPGHRNGKQVQVGLGSRDDVRKPLTGSVKGTTGQRQSCTDHILLHLKPMPVGQKLSKLGGRVGQPLPSAPAVSEYRGARKSTR